MRFSLLVPIVLTALLCCAGQSQRPLFLPASGSPIPVAGGPQNVLVGDVNNDGKPDLVIGNGKGRSVAVLLGDGVGGFTQAPGSTVALQGSAGEMALGDLNSDRKLDLAVGDHDSYGVTILLGDARGGFTPAPGSPFAASEGTRPHTHGLALADLNRDSRLDVATVNNNDNSVSVLLGDGTGRFKRAKSSPFAVGEGPYPLGVGDVNGDGTLDIVTPGRQNLTVLLGDGRGNFRPAAGSPISVVPGPYYVALGNVNGNKKLDVITSHGDSSVLSVLLGDGRGGFTPASGSPVKLEYRAWGVVVVDVNQDGRTDLVAATNTTVSVLLGNGQGGFRVAPGSPFTVGKGAWRLAVADLNRDGKPDIVTSNLESDNVSVLLGQ